MWPQFSQKMIESVSDVLKSGKVNQWTNPIVNEFEMKFSEYIGNKYSIAVANGTVALELCFEALGLEKGSEVIVSPRTFIASISSIIRNDLVPVFADVDINSQNITLEYIKEKISDKTKAVILVHLTGYPCEIEEICKYCRENNIYVIEDCAQSHGAKYNDKSVGTFGDINAWSFCQDKIMTTGGEGGMVTTNNEELFKIAWSIKDHGKNYDKIFGKDKNKNEEIGFKWLHDRIGTNYRMTAMQAAIGICALDELGSWVKHRRKIAKIYDDNLAMDGIRICVPESHIYHSYYKYYFFVDFSKFTIGKNDLIKKVSDNNVKIFSGSCGKVFEETAIDYGKDAMLENIEELDKSAVMLLCDPTVNCEVALHNVSVIKDVLAIYKLA